jgi:hypothetical protein
MSVAAVVRAASTVGLTDLETTILKATYEDEKGPKPKHVASMSPVYFAYRSSNTLVAQSTVTKSMQCSASVAGEHKLCRAHGTMPLLHCY